MEIIYYEKDGKKYAKFNGLKFKQEKSGYYVINNNWDETIKNNYRLHVAVWEYFNNQTVEKGYCIHHIDSDKTNNDLSNLQCVSFKEHRRIHDSLLTEEERKNKYKKFIENGVKAAADKCRGIPISEEQKRKISQTFKNKPDIEHICEYCGKKFTTKSNRARFCPDNQMCRIRFYRGWY